MSAVRIGFLGLGTVGMGALTTLREEQARIARQVGCELVPVRAAVRDLHKARGAALEGVELTTDPMAVATADDVDIVVEVIGGVGVAKDAVEAAMTAGKSVVTANKELLAKHGYELFRLAEQRRVDIAFEGSVGGGIPIIRPLRNSLTGITVNRLMGIINGTTNYILSEMDRTGRAFADLLAEAQAKGYAESDPSDDINGHDAAYKLAILAMLAFDTGVDESDVYREGIAHITPQDIAVARQLGYRIKLLAIGQDDGDRLELRVHPTLVPTQHPLASVNDVYNAIFVEGSAVGQVMFFGRGAGAGPTGSAVVGDLIEVARNLRNGVTGSMPLLATGRRAVAGIAEARSSYYVRMTVRDRTGVLATIAGCLGEEDVSIAQVLQTQSQAGGAELVWITHESDEARMSRALDQIRALDVVLEVSNLLRCLAVE